ncbi:hypothetical protein LA080_001200 [Diaporthe eres]|nr:hypothetical protein LA080_001200 [Diaporthe eres]
MDQEGAEMLSRGLDMKGLGPWNTWPNRFAILDDKYYTMMYSRTRNHGVYIGIPYEPSNHSSNYGSRGGVALNAERTVIGASYTLSLLQNARDDQRSSRHRCYETKANHRTNRMALLSAVARGMCRRPGEVLALCLEVQRNNLTAITQNQLYGDGAERGVHTLGKNEGTYLPMEDDVQSLPQKMKELDEKPDLVDHLANLAERHVDAISSELEKETKHIQSAVRKLSMRETVWMHPICLVLKLEIFGQGGMWEFDDKALLDFGERILEDLRQGKHRNADIQTPWGDTYNDIPMAYWARSAREALWRHEDLYRSAPHDGQQYSYPEEMIDAGEQAHFADTQYSSGESSRKAHEDKPWDSILECSVERELFDDCCSIDYWARTHAQMAKTMGNFRSVTGGKPPHISIAQDEAAVQMSENDARSCAIQLWASLIDDWRKSDTISFYGRRAMRESWNCLIRAWEERADDSWWPKEMHNYEEHQHHSWGKTHCSAIFFAILRLLVPGTHTAYSTWCLPPGAKEAVVESVAKALKEEICNALRDWRVEAFFRTLARSADGQLPSSPDYSYSDEASDTSADTCQPS